MRTIATAFTAALLLGALLTAPASAQSAADFYGRTSITLIVGAGPGGGYDLYSRIFTKYFSRYIPGHPFVVVKNMAGAGGINAADYLFNIAAKDGSIIEMPLPSTLISEAIRPEMVRYRLSDFGWIGTISTMTDVLGVSSDAGTNTIEDAKQKSVVIGSTNKFSQTNFQPALVNALLGTKFRIVDGYRSMNEIVLAMDRGEVKGHTDPWSSWITQRSEMIQNGKIKLLLQFGPKLKEIANVPAFRDLVKTPADRDLVDFVGLMQVIGRSLAAPPDIPADRLAALRQAFDDTIKDPEFVETIKTSHMELYPRSGIELQQALSRMLASEKETAVTLKAILEIN